ncbi:hypothetical protein AAFH68_10030 [Flavobacterium sp. CGRL1]
MFVLINTQLSSAQQTVTLDETIFIHTNAVTLVSGETLLYKVYCLKSSDKTPSGISKVAYVELVDDNKKSVFKTKIALENASGQGDYFIPTTLKTGTYKLIGYTNWMLNKPFSELFQLNINIVNPYKVDEKTASQNIFAGNTNTTAESLKNENVTLNLNKKIFSNRELVDLKIKSSNANYTNGTYSLSVRKLDNIPAQNQISAVNFAAATAYPVVLDLKNENQKIILPES